MKLSSPVRLLSTVTASLLLVGCGGTKQKFYQLSADAAAPTGTAGLSVGVGPISLPGYIDRAELVFQSGANQYQIPTDANWIGSLKENISRVLAADLGARLHSGNVLSFPWNAAAKLRYHVAVDVAQFNATSGQGVILDVSWRVLNGSDDSLIARHNARFEDRVEGDGYDPVVAAQSRLLAKLADAMASSLSRR